MSDPCERLSEFLDGHLDGAEEQAFALHFVDCHRCLETSEELNALDALTIDAEEERVLQGAGADALGPPPNPASVVPGVQPATATVPVHVPAVAAAQSVPAIAAVLAVPAVPATPVGSEGGRVISMTWRRAKQLAVVAVPMAAAFAVGLRMQAGWGVERLVEELVASQPERPLEGRVAVAAADVYRAHRARDVMRGDGLSEMVRRATPGALSTGDIMRGGGAPASSLPAPSMERMARLAKRGRWQELAAAWMLAGNLEEAERTLAQAPDSPSVRSDGAALAIMRGRPEQALILADSAMTSDTASTQALWNRALALRDLGLPAVAARAFREVAARGEAGWSDEARQQAEALEVPLAAARHDFQETWKAGDGMFRRGGAPLSAQQAAGHPGTARLFLYDALRAATSPARVRELVPLAETLDGVYSGHSLSQLARSVATADFSLRAPLAARYPEMLPGDKHVLDSELVNGYLDEVRRAGQPDILLGALWPQERLREHIGEYHELAHRSGDAWFDYIVVVEEAAALVKKGRVQAAREQLLAALESCHATRLEYRCNKLESELTWLFRKHGSSQEAWQMARVGLAHARETGEWNHVQLFLMFLGDIERDRRAFALADAYLDEAQLRQFDAAARRDYAAPQREVAAYHSLQRVEAALESLRIDEAREAMARYLASTDQALGVNALAALVELQHWRPVAGEQQRVRDGIAQIRRDQGTEPGALALATAVEGRLVAEQDADAGRPLLERAVREAEAVLDPSDVEAARARAASYAALIDGAGGKGSWNVALDLVARTLGVDEPGPCSLGVSLDYDRLLVAARDRDGRSDGMYLPHRPPADGGANLVPESIRARLTACEVVDVYSLLPAEAGDRLLPPDMAWRYRVRAARPSSGAAPVGARRLVVAATTPPAWLGLPPLTSPASIELSRPDAVRLEGEFATPTRVLEAMADAAEIEFHVHGLVDSSLSDVSVLVLSREAGGRYALTADDVRGRRLRGAPLVILAACRAGASVPSRHRPWGLPGAFLEAGARAVVATPEPLSDAGAAAFFDDMRRSLAAGHPVAVALRDARKNSRNNQLHPSLSSMQLFE